MDINSPQIDEFLINKLNKELTFAEQLMNGGTAEALEAAYLLLDHIMERIGLCVFDILLDRTHRFHSTLFLHLSLSRSISRNLMKLGP